MSDLLGRVARWPPSLKKPTTVFFTAAVGPHRIFALPYAYSILFHNPDAAVEILVDDVEQFRTQYAAAIARIGPRMLLRNALFSAKDAPYMRFLYQPETKAPYVYIGDVDILILEGAITETHIANATKLGLPYSNMLRDCGTRLTGLHFTEWDAYYPIEPLPMSKLRKWVGDETLLKTLVERRGLPMPQGTFRPKHGIHMSLNRDSVVREAGQLSWGVGWAEWASYQKFVKDSDWTAFLSLLDPDYRALIEKLESAATNKFDKVPTTSGIQSTPA